MLIIALIVSSLAAYVFAMLLLRERRNRRLDALKRELLEVEVDVAAETRWRNELLGRLVNGIEDGLLIVSADLKVLFLNDGATRFWPSSVASIGRPLHECIRDHRVTDLVAKAQREGKRLTEQLILATARDAAAGTGRIFAIEAVPLFDRIRSRRDEVILVVLRDESEKHELEKIRRDFVANASHELRTPLSIINGYLENLEGGDLPDPAQQHRVFGIMKKHGDRLARIVEDMLVISRLESGDGETLKLAPLDLRACAEDVTHMLSQTIAACPATVNVVVEPGTNSVIEGDRYYWEQIFFNLIENALKENTGRELKVTVAIAQTPDGLRVQIKDNGVGIPGADQPFVFKRFYRVSSQRPKHIKGTGLGLSIVKRAVEAHRGTISLTSKPGIETVFTIDLTKAKAAESRSPVP